MWITHHAGRRTSRVGERDGVVVPAEFLEVTLDRAAHLKYLRQQFAIHAFGERLLGMPFLQLDLTRGRAWALVPVERAEDAVDDLETDAIRRDGQQERLALALAKRIRPLLDATPPRILTIEYWTEAYLDGMSRTRQFKVGDSVFDYVTASDSDEQVAYLLESCLWYPTIGLIAPIPEGVDLDQTKELTTADVDQLVAHPDLVLVGAWCADGYVFWQPDQGESANAVTD